MSACADDECIRIFHQRGGEVFSRRIDHFIGYLFDGFLYKGILLSTITFITLLFIAGKVRNNS